MTNKYLVYTCVTNNYDKINSISVKQDPNIDFICFTDKVRSPVNGGPNIGWTFYPIPEELNGLDPRRKARLVKILINKWAKGYNGYLWIDSPIVIIGNLGPFFASHPFDEQHGIYVSKHYMRDCTYQEFAQVVRLGKDRSAVLYDQLARYKKMGYPSHNGMAETSILYRNLKDMKVQIHADQWAHEIINYSYRDQLSFNWAGWYTKTPITYLNEHIYIKDTENETSDYFFLPWPKHKNDHVNQQVRECLAKRKKAIAKIQETEYEIDHRSINESINERKGNVNFKKIHLMHWFFKDRKILEFDDIEKFHIKMLEKCGIRDKFDEIYFNFSMENFEKQEQKDFIIDSMHQKFDRDGLKLTITFEKNDPSIGELNTNFRLFDLAFDNPDNTLLFYSHSKGVTKTENKDILNEKYWSYLMYQGCLLDGYEEAMKALDTNPSYGAILNDTTKLYVNEIKNYPNLIKTTSPTHYFGTFYWLNLGWFKKKYQEFNIGDFKKKIFEVVETLSNTNKLKTEFPFNRRFQSETLIPQIFSPNICFSKFDKKRCSKSCAELYENDSKTFGYVNEFNKELENPRVLVYTYAENLNRSNFEFSKTPGVDYILFTDKESTKSNYKVEKINFDVGNTIFQRNKFYKWHPELLNTKEYDYIIYHDIRINITNVFGLINEMKSSKYGINLSKHRKSNSIESELKGIDKLIQFERRSNIPKDYVESLRKKIGEKNLSIKSIMPEATVIVYEMKKLDYDLKNLIYREFKNFGSIRDQPAISNVCLNNNVDISSICTLNGFVPLGREFKKSKKANKYLREIPSYYTT